MANSYEVRDLFKTVLLGLLSCSLDTNETPQVIAEKALRQAEAAAELIEARYPYLEQQTHAEANLVPALPVADAELVYPEAEKAPEKRIHHAK